MNIYYSNYIVELYSIVKLRSIAKRAVSFHYLHTLEYH